MNRDTYPRGDTDEQCPNCGYYRVGNYRYKEWDTVTEEYDGWKWWKDTRSKWTVVESGEFLQCDECGWHSDLD